MKSNVFFFYLFELKSKVQFLLTLCSFILFSPLNIFAMFDLQETDIVSRAKKRKGIFVEEDSLVTMVQGGGSNGKKDAQEMEGIVVTGFQNKSKNKFSGAAVNLKASEIKMEGVADVSRMLEGRAAGVTVQNVSGTFGSAPKVRIRGATSLTGDNKPLWVVDGVILEEVVNVSNDQLSSGDPTTLLGSAVAGLNSNDIESFSILKDAAATAMYGARAANGVVVITTKKGRKGKTTISYNLNLSTALKPSYNDYNILTSQEQMSVYSELSRFGWLNYSKLSNNSDAGVFGKMATLIDTFNPETGEFVVANTTEGRANFLKRYANANTDWFDILFRNQLIQEHSLSVSSGGEKSQTYFSLSYYGDNGWTVADNVKRYTLNFRNNYNFSDKLSVGFTTLGSFRQQKAPGTLKRISNVVSGSFDRDFDINPFSYALNTSRVLTAFDEHGNREFFKRNFAGFNILHELENNNLNITVFDLKLQGSLEYKFTSDLRFEFLGAVRYVNSLTESKIHESSNLANAYRAAQTSTIREANKFLYRDPDNPNLEKQVVLPEGGFYNRAGNSLLTYDIRNTIYYQKTFGEEDQHFISAIAGQQIRYVDRQTSENTGYGYQYEKGGIPSIDPLILKQSTEANFLYYGMQNSYDRFAAFYVTTSYTYDGRFNVGINGRYDGSNRLGASINARWTPTYSMEASWNIEKEAFMSRIKFINSFKLRTSYGLTASLGNARNSTTIFNTGVTNRPFLAEKETVINLTSLENSQLTWEKLNTLDIGFDGAFFNRRLNVSFDYYTRKSFDLINVVKTSGIGGESFKNANFADMTSNGVELSLSYTAIKNKQITWRVTYTVGYNKTLITRADNIPSIFNLVAPEGGFKKGYPVRGLFSIDYVGLESNTGIPLFINEEGNVDKAVYLQSLETKYLKYEGPVDPTTTGGLNNSVEFKGFSLNVFITYSAGNKIRLNSAFRASYTDLDAMPREFLSRYIFQGDQNKTDVPSIMDAFISSQNSSVYPYNNYNFSSARVADGGFVRLKSVSLGYNIPKKWVTKMRLSAMSLMLSAYNLWLIYSDPKLQGQDPEFFNSGGVAQPIQKQFTFTLKCTM